MLRSNLLTSIILSTQLFLKQDFFILFFVWGGWWVSCVQHNEYDISCMWDVTLSVQLFIVILLFSSFSHAT